MNTYHSSKTMTMLKRLRQQQDEQNIAPIDSTDEDESSTVQNIFVEKKNPISSSGEEQQTREAIDGEWGRRNRTRSAANSTRPAGATP